MVLRRQLTLSPTSVDSDLPEIDDPQFSSYDAPSTSTASSSSASSSSTASSSTSRYPYPLTILTDHTDRPHRHGKKPSLSLPRFAPSSPLKPIPYPYPSSLGFTLRSTLRARRRSSLVRLAQRRLVHILLALSLPLLLGLILHEHSVHSHRTSFRPQQGPLHPDTKRVILRDLRSVAEEKRRKEIVTSRTPFRRSWLSARDKEEPGSLWTWEDELEVRKEAEDTWPTWWGNVDEVGRSPWDHIPGPISGGKRRILFLTDYRDYLERMNTHTYEIVDAALRHPNAITDVWGPGWAGYNNSLPLSVNVRRRQARIAQLEESKDLNAKQAGSSGNRDEAVISDWDLSEDQIGCGAATFDIVWTISDIFRQNDPHLDALDCGSLLVQQLGDCHNLGCMREWYPQANNITVSKYAFELPEIFDHNKVKAHYPAWHMGMFGHSPDTANEWDFWPGSWADKSSDATIFGFDGSFYPIRTTITDHIRDDPSPSFNRQDHPGYTLSVPDAAFQHPLETYTKGHELYQTHEALRGEFARAMRQAKICVFDASLERKMIRKYAQALLSGCVIAADLPTEHEEALEGFVIQLKPSWDIDRIKKEVNRYLAEPERLHQMALDGLVYARQHLTSTRKVTDIIRMADAHKAGTRGYDLPHSFSLRCRAYWSDDDSYRPPWCKVGPHRGLEG